MGYPKFGAANATPMATCGFDPTSGLIYSPGCANYSAINTAGTTTVVSGAGGILYGFNAITTGTSWTVVAYDIAVSGTSTTTSQLIPTTTATSVGFQANPGSGGTGVRFTGSLAVVTTGTPGLWNVLWD